MRANKFSMTAAMLISLASIFQFCLIVGAARLERGDSDDEYHHQLDQSPQTDRILNSESAEQQRIQQADPSRRQQYILNNNGPDVVEDSNQPLIRLQRSLVYNQASAAPLLTSQQLQQLEEEQTLRRQLPDLMAQARTDKAIERTLLKMLISASLKPVLPHVSERQTNPYYNAGRLNLWQDSVEGNLNGFEPAKMSPRLEQQARNNYASADPLGSDSGQTYRQNQYQSIVDKREYIKPCSFNAVSCAKNPFRKL